MSRIADLEIGSQHGMLTVEGPGFRTRFSSGNCRRMQVFLCSCGRYCAHGVGDVKSGRCQSCGCHRKEVGRSLGKRNTTHGMTNTHLYDIWHLMKLRCTDPGQECYKRYGGRGISVCEEWVRSFEAFHAWATCNGYMRQLQIDRIDNDGNYEPANCRWVTCKENNNNRCTSVLVTYMGDTMSLKQWSEQPECSVPYSTLWRRYKDGWPFEKALKLPPTPRGSARFAIAKNVGARG